MAGHFDESLSNNTISCLFDVTHFLNVTNLFLLVYYKHREFTKMFVSLIISYFPYLKWV